MGVSVGSIVAGPTIEMALTKSTDKNLVKLQNLAALSLIGFEIKPHYEARYFGAIYIWARQHGARVHTVDDGSAVSVDGQNVQIVGNGQSKLANYVK